MRNSNFGFPRVPPTSSAAAAAAEPSSKRRRIGDERNRYQQGDTELKESVTNISHDLRTPLTAICGYLDLLSQEALPEQARRYLGFIKNRTTAMKQLTAELFRYSIVRSTETEQPEQLTLNRVLEESLASYYAAMCQKQITPVISIPEQPVRRYLEPTALTRIFENILSNVLKYSDGDVYKRQDRHSLTTSGPIDRHIPQRQNHNQH